MLAALAMTLPALAAPDPLPATIPDRAPLPTFDELHEQYARICLNESGFSNVADQDGILQALLYGGGGRRHNSRRTDRWGLDHRKLMTRMLRHSPRTFPADSRFLPLDADGRSRHADRQTALNRWTSTFTLDCSMPAGWPIVSPDDPAGTWTKYAQRCQDFTASTRNLLQGNTPTACDGQPTTWGSDDDVLRPGGALDSGWKEIHCDRPPDSKQTCALKSAAERWRSSSCAINTFWTWLEFDDEAAAAARRARCKRARPPANPQPGR